MVSVPRYIIYISTTSFGKIDEWQKEKERKKRRKKIKWKQNIQWKKDGLLNICKDIPIGKSKFQPLPHSIHTN